MLNDYWEEQNMDKKIALFHEDKMEEMELPEWILNIQCPFCAKPIPKRSVRNIQLCLNTRNFGEVAVEILCDECRKMDTLYFRTNGAVKNLSHFISYINGTCNLLANPILEEEMFKMNYNNVVELMLTQNKEE